MAFTIVLALRIAQFIVALLTMGLAGYVFHWYDVDTYRNPPTQINFLIATPAFTFLSLLYLEITPRYIQKISVPYIHVALEVINAVLYFAGFIALSVFLGKLIHCKGKVCASARGAAIFSAFNFLLWGATTALLALEIFKGGMAGMKTDKAAVKAMEQSKQQAGNNNEMKAQQQAQQTV